MDNNNFSILPFTNDNLAFSLSNNFIDPDSVKKKYHYIYLLDYLSSSTDSLEAKTIIIEKNYISKSYITDYADYYSKCFKDYGRITNRIHFFSSNIDDDKFLELLSSGQEDSFWDSYLGFIVAKPLPDSIIGPTLLKTFHNPEEDNRKFTVTKTYEVHLFGKKLKLISLIYQEQDTVLSACATAALWCAFQKTSELFHSLQPSPSEITNMAGNLFFNSGRTFPNHGLDVYQICKAIESVGLVSELRNKNSSLNDLKFFKSFVYSYLRIGLPVLLGLEITGIGHLVTLTGYKENFSSQLNSPDLTLTAHQIDRLYAHDDQIGPFSRIGFHGNEIITSWKDIKTNNLLKAKIIAVFIPLYPKIRITFEDVFTKINILDQLLDIISISGKEIVWDIFLDFSNEFKNEIRINSQLDADYKQKLLLNSMPRFIWRAKAIVNNNAVMELIFDATDISRGFFCTQIIIFNNDFKDNLRIFFDDQNFKNTFINLLDENYFKLFKKEFD
ncbi:MAG: hypothetical protein IPM38_08830 [Ignavibacteria bacterium]|nr:hypothetical protein [Ignavibacteria bacterium]